LGEFSTLTMMFRLGLKCRTEPNLRNLLVSPRKAGCVNKKTLFKPFPVSSTAKAENKLSFSPQCPCAQN
jgi:hypothetical protein